MVHTDARIGSVVLGEVVECQKLGGTQEVKEQQYGTISIAIVSPVCTGETKYPRPQRFCVGVQVKEGAGVYSENVSLVSPTT